MNEQDISIDIHIVKLEDWLISRRIVGKNFHVYIRDIRDKISNAIQDMPESPDLVNLLSKTREYNLDVIILLISKTSTTNIHSRHQLFSLPENCGNIEGYGKGYAQHLWTVWI